MKHLNDLMKFLDSEKSTIGEKGKIIYDGLKLKFKDFLSKLEEEGGETKHAFELLVQSTFENRELTKEERTKVGDQIKDVLKTVGLIGLAALPGGSLFFIMTKFLRVNKYILPSSFLSK